MKRLQALELIKQYYSEPVFNVKIGIGSPQIQRVDFESALEEFDRCCKWTTEYTEYVFIYVSDYVKDSNNLERALNLFNLGPSRGSLNQHCFT